MKQQRQPNSSSSRLATVLLLTIALPCLLFSRCSADDSSSLIIDRRATGLKEKQLQRRLKKINQKRIRQHESLLESDVPVTDGFAIAAASAGAKSSKAAPPGAGPRTAPPVAPPTFPPTVSSQPSFAPSKSGKSSPRSRR
eukprot:scaffold2412_cov136-Skeletonema_marinoi.AAC.1